MRLNASEYCVKYAHMDTCRLFSGSTQAQITIRQHHETFVALAFAPILRYYGYMILLLKFGLKIYAVIYAILKLFPAKDKVVFLSRQGNSPGLDFQLLEKEIRRSHPGYDTVMLCRKIEGGIPGAIGYCFHMIRQCWHLATAKVAILDSYCILASCLKHKPCLLIVQIWHSVGTMKKNGYSVLDQPEGSSSKVAHAMHMHENYDYIFASADAYKPYLAEAFNQPVSRVITKALPRIELLKDVSYKKAKREEIFSVYPELTNGKKNLVYCPTFRKGEDPALFDEALRDLVNAIDKDKYNIIIKVHPLAAPASDIPGALTDRKFSTFEMLFAGDLVVSDYSCIVYEAAVLNLPIYFYAYDFDTYVTTRGMYIDYKKEMPVHPCKSAQELAQQLEKPYDFASLFSFRDKYVDPANHDETASIVSFIFEHLK